MFVQHQSPLLAQPPSFQVQMDSLPTVAIYNDLVINEQDKILMLMNEAFQPTLFSLYVIPVSGIPGASDALKIKYPGHKIRRTISVKYAGDKLFMFTNQTIQGPGSREVLSCIDLVTEQNWSLKVSDTEKFYTSAFELDGAGNGILANGVLFDPANPIYPQSNAVELFKLAPNGSTIWKKGLALTKNGQSIGNLVSILKVGTSSTNEIYLLGHFATIIASNKGPQFIVKLDAQGNPVKWKLFKDAYFFDMIVEDDGIYIWDKNPHWSEYTSAGFGIDKSSLRLAKLDHDLNLLWGKNYDAENFDYFTASLVQTGANKLALAHTTFGSFPAILSEIDNNGNILSQKGYPNYQPNIFALGNGSLVLASPFNANFSPFTPIIAKTDTNGDIAGCPTFPTCLKVEDTEVEFEDFEIEVIDIADLETLPPIDITPVTVNFHPYCDYPPAPVPTFTFPDTLCTGESAISVSEGNKLAQAREWQLTGPSTDSLLLDSFEFSYRFDLPGEYLLRQSVWVLGCRTDYERSITVLPALTVDIAGDIIICPGEAMEIIAQANRTASFLWANGQTAPTLPIVTSGQYAVVATDGHCTASDSMSVTVVADLLNGKPPFTLPRDTTTCLPFELVPHSSFTSQFFTELDSTPTGSFLLDESGNYRIGMEAFGCKFWDVFKYEVDCHVDIYLPTSFSPNGDGINDVFQPFGNDFEVLELTVFDRWGGLRYKGKAWDGGSAGQGVYVYLLHYRNLRSGETVALSGEVELVK
ncbi:MAG: gliding motility-associated C-terminal domain-containing protein [Saprospiraceae bacterium]|nr:gliding motility-associated C-terminal domain-containing protein [Saprospiraceae bacterium]MCF8248643.1 gliding motility-associated C-terminal domain-containing protein [Saprospiraceae bacterium]MCF8278867.1 gliding motility-associated C-terminal domain-containing protein [Bacteroidales bacterium]MCF8310667.1 gliding motility-associated C-terminal domain-containing protein [Saprospiraceae bacterium]MCF8439226.1 gliding motility-associated C-terminal domain-containing protein [Saprospiraceae 